MTTQVAAVAISGILGAAVLSAAAQSTKIELKNAQGQSVGAATITANKGGGVTIKADFKGLPPESTLSTFIRMPSAKGRHSQAPRPSVAGTGTVAILALIKQALG